MFTDLTQVLQNIAVEKHVAVTRMISGQCQDFAAYRHLVGVIEGLDKACVLIMKSGDDNESD